MRFLPRGLAGLAALSALAMPAAGAGGGHVTVDGIRLDLAHAYALWVEDGAPGERRVLLLVTDRPIDAEAAASALNPGGQAAEQLAASGGGLVAVAVGADGGEQGLSFWRAAPESRFETTAVGSFALTRFTAERIAGAWQCEAPYEFALTFDAEISDLAVRGTRLGGGGGEPGAAYLAYAEALRRGDAPTLRRLMGERAVATLPEAADPATLAVILSWLPSGRPVTPVVRSALLRDDTAVLWIEGADPDGRALSGRVLMARTPAGWREVEADLSSD